MPCKRTAAIVIAAAMAVSAGRVWADVDGVQPRATPRCGTGQLDEADFVEDVAAHRQFELPVLHYPADAKREQWGVPLTLLVDRSGRVACWTIESSSARESEMSAQRERLLRATSAWRYRPFLHDGMPEMAVVTESIAEERVAGPHRPMPAITLDQVTISLSRSGCLGSCPDYRVRIRGDGTVEYQGSGFVDVLGKHVYRIPPGEVEALVAKLRRADLWSMAPSYRAMITDNPFYELTFELGNQVHRIEDYVGTAAGMPQVVRDFEDEVDRAARSSEWINLSTAAVEQLQREGFDFRSQEAADLLARAVANDAGQEEPAMLRMMQLGTPVEGGNALGDRIPPGARVRTSLLEDALLHHRTTLIDPLLARGALRTAGVLDRAKVNAAFREAVRGGRLSLVQKIWNRTDPQTRPSLWFEDEDDRGGRRTVPVTMELSRPYRDDGWEGREIAQWLANMGCDLKAHAADGDTLLHRAVDAGDVGFVRYLIAKGLDVSAPGNYDLPPLGSARDEDIALLLLQSGSDWRMDDHGEGFLRYARGRHWGRVLSWLRQH